MHTAVSVDSHVLKTVFLFPGSQVLFAIPQHKYKNHIHSAVHRQEGAKERAGLPREAHPAPDLAAHHKHSRQHSPPDEPPAVTHRNPQVRPPLRLWRHTCAGDGGTAQMQTTFKVSGGNAMMLTLGTQKH